MAELLWFLSGCVVTATGMLVVFAGLRARRRSVEPKPPPPHKPAPKRPRPRRIELSETRPLRELSESLGDELASLATGVEGQSQLLCESLGEPQRVMEHAEQLWETVRRLRFFSEKLQSSSVVPQLEMRSTDIGQLLAALVLEIEDYSQVTLQVSLNTAPSLPLGRANATSLRTAIFFLIESVFELEPNASTLLLQAQAQARAQEDDEDGEESLHVRIDIEAILEDGDEIRVKSPPEVLFSFNAAKNLLHAQGADVTLDHSPGLNAMASITMAAAPDDEITSEIELDADEQPHRFGGVLVMEGNPTIRHMLARELEKTERNVIVCADGIAAATLFNATPERFELLILEKESRRMPGETLALRALEQNPDLKIILVTPAPGSGISRELSAHPHLRALHKPFGLMEFREAVGQTLGPEPIRIEGSRPAGAEAS